MLLSVSFVIKSVFCEDRVRSYLSIIYNFTYDLQPSYSVIKITGEGVARLKVIVS